MPSFTVSVESIYCLRVVGNSYNIALTIILCF